MRNLIQRTLTVTALAAGMAFAQGASTPDIARPRVRALRQRIAQQLNLTDAQKQQIKAINQQARLDAQPLRQELKQNRQAMKLAIQSGKSDSEIQQLAATQGNILGQMLAVRGKARARIEAQLTPEQKAQAAALRDKVRTRVQQRLQKRKG